MVRLLSPQVPRKKDQAGFAIVPIIIMTIILLAVGIFFLKPGFINTSSNNPVGRTFQKLTNSCEEEFTKFTYPILSLTDIELIEPMGKMSSSHITPTDHQYWRPKPWRVEPKPRDVFSPGAGTITKIEKLNFPHGNGQVATDYNVIIQHSCDVSTNLIHITELSEKIVSQAGGLSEGESKKVNIPVEVGERLGLIRGTSEDFGNIYQVDVLVIDESRTLPGFVNPESTYYQQESWKVHIADPFDYFAEPLRSELVAKSPRLAAPVGGKIDYDIDGKLVGNWFKEGHQLKTEEDYFNYWENHLSSAYDYMDPTHVQISIGDYSGQNKQFGVKGNEPDPAEVDVETGLVKYELVGFEYITTEGERWDRENFAKIDHVENYDQVYGVVLVQLLEDRKLKFEAFPDKTVDQVSSFTQNAKIYVR